MPLAKAGKGVACVERSQETCLYVEFPICSLRIVILTLRILQGSSRLIIQSFPKGTSEQFDFD